MFSRLVIRLSSSSKFSFSTTNFIPPLAKIQALIREGESQLSDPNSLQSAISSFKAGATLSSEIYPTKPLQQSIWYLHIALTLASKSHLKESKEYLTQGLNLLSQYDQSHKCFELCRVYYTLGHTFIFHNDFIQSEKYFSEALTMSELISPELKLPLLEKYYLVKLQLEKKKEALKLAEEALEIYEKLGGRESDHASMLSGYGGLLFQMKDVERALKMYNKSLSISRKLKNDENSAILRAQTYEYLVDANLEIGNDDEAVQAALSGGNSLKSFCATEQILLYYWNMLQKFKNQEIAEPILKAIIEHSEVILSDSLKLNQSYKLAAEYYYRLERLDESLAYAEKYLKVAKKFDDLTSLLDAYAQLGEIYLKIDTDVAKSYIDLGTALLEKQSNPSHQQAFDHLLFIYYSKNNDYENAEKYISSCIKLAVDTKEMAPALISLYIENSLLHYEHVRLEKSLKSLFKALEVYDKYFSRQDIRCVDILSKIGGLYLEGGNYEKSLEYLIEALDIVRTYAPKDEIQHLVIHTNIIGCYARMNQLPLAFEAGERVLELIQQNKQFIDFHQGLFYMAFGELSQKMMKREQSKNYFLKAREIFSKFEADDYVEAAENCIRNLTS